MDKTIKRIITYGTFDLFHIGHLNLLKNLKELADELYVGISSDEFNTLKGKNSIIPFEQRSEIVSSIKYVDKVFKEDNWEQKIDDIKKYNISIFAIGNDWVNEFDYLKAHCDVIYLNRTDGISSTSLKKTLNIFSNVDKKELINALDILERLKNDLS